MLWPDRGACEVAARLRKMLVNVLRESVRFPRVCAVLLLWLLLLLPLCTVEGANLSSMNEIAIASLCANRTWREWHKSCAAFLCGWHSKTDDDYARCDRGG